MADWRLAEPVNMIGWRRGITPLRNHSVAVAGAAMTRRAIDIETFLAAQKDFARDREWKCCNKVRPDFASVKRFVGIQMAARNRVRRKRTRSHAVVLKEIALLQWLFGGLLKHVTAAAGDTERKEQGQCEEGTNLEPRTLNLEL
jgi:hypothetical protein